MAGCRPDHLPVLLAATEVLLDPAYGVEHSGNTTGADALSYLFSEEAGVVFQVSAEKMEEVASVLARHQLGAHAVELGQPSEGETISIFGNDVNSAGVYSETFTASNGCDSTHTIMVSVLPTPQTSESISICDGETVQVFGNSVSCYWYTIDK